MWTALCRAADWLWRHRHTDTHSQRHSVDIMWAGRTVWRPGVVIVPTRYIPEHFPEKKRTPSVWTLQQQNYSRVSRYISVKIYSRYLLNVGSRHLQSIMLKRNCFFSLISYLVENTVCLNDRAQKWQAVTNVYDVMWTALFCRFERTFEYGDKF
jgi:hypothetical protein